MPHNIAGFWPSCFDSSCVEHAQEAISGNVTLHGNMLYATRNIVAEGGRCDILSINLDNRDQQSLIPAPFSIGSKVNEYGGKAYYVDNDIIYFVDYVTQNIYKIQDDNIILYHESCHAAYSELIYSQKHQALFAIEEADDTHAIVMIHDNGQRIIIQQGQDFYAAIALNHDENELAFLHWNFPDMPWDSAHLSTVTLHNTASIKPAKLIAGAANISAFQPHYSHDNMLYYCADNHKGFWQLHYDDGKTSYALDGLADDVECALPLWQAGMRTYAINTNKDIVILGATKGIWQVFIKYQYSNKFVTINLPYHDFKEPLLTDDTLYILAAHNGSDYALLAVKLHDINNYTVVIDHAIQHDDAWISKHQTLHVIFNNSTSIYGNYYAPTNPNCTLNNNELPPLLIKCHGGPSGQADTNFQFKIQYWTSRGFAVFDLNYRGSTGYGRTYRESLYGQWGINDIVDCEKSVEYLIKHQLAHPDYVFISGSSAGGFTVLAACTFSNIFTAGTSAYGISDLTLLLQDTHKFERRYLDKLIGVYPQDKHIYNARSPLHHAHHIQAPILFLQGDKDKIVPLNQTLSMADALKRNNIYHEVEIFEGEGHGFRKSTNKKHALEKELAFYQRIMEKT